MWSQITLVAAWFLYAAIARPKDPKHSSNHKARILQEPPQQGNLNTSTSTVQHVVAMKESDENDEVDSRRQGSDQRRTKAAKGPLEQVHDILRRSSSPSSDAALNLVPLKYEKYGQVLVVAPVECDVYPAALGAALCQVLKVNVIVTQSRSGGELRTPTRARVLYRATSDASTIATHNEHGTLYSFDVLKIMWSSGNVKERSKYGKQITASGEIVLDMFAGIGYFSLPLSTPPNPEKRPKLLIAIEKNSDSFHYLCHNFERARAQQQCCPFLLLNGDNRHMGDEYCGQCDRILMGYLPDTERFIPRAVEFASKTRVATLHFHFLHGTHENGAESCAEHFAKVLPTSNFKVMEVRKIKSYAPKIVHAVADVVLTL